MPKKYNTTKTEQMSIFTEQDQTDEELHTMLSPLSSIPGIASTLLAIIILSAGSVFAQTDTVNETAPLAQLPAEHSQKQAEGTKAMSTSFLLELHTSSRQSTRDSRGSSRSLIIKDGFVMYSASHFGLHSRPNREDTFEFSDKNRDKLIAYIIENKLNRNIEETKEDTGLGTSIKLSIRIQIDDTITEAKIAGTYRDVMKIRQNKPPSNLENEDYYDEIQYLLSFMGKELGFTVIEP